MGNHSKALTEYLKHLNDTYQPKQIMITENGASFSGEPGADGLVHDPERIAYLESHISAVEAARVAGVPVGGYFVWSLLDNFEWSLGFTQQFGLVWVDMASGTRIPKDSFYWYRRRIHAG